MTSVFIIRGFGTKTDSKGNKVDFDRVQTELIMPAIEACNLVGGTTAIVEDSGNIRADMFELILQSDVVICDITIHNANVFYELGIRHSLRKNHTILIKGSPSSDKTPFDIAPDKYLRYSVADPSSDVPALIKRLKATLLSNRETDSPVFQLLPTLKEPDRSAITVTPLDLIEEIERAESKEDKALLRVIAEDLNKQRFEQDGLRRVGKSQLKLQDMRSARDIWEKITTAIPADFDANSALANIYERQYRESLEDELLQMSQQSISRVLDSPLCLDKERAEMLGLEGRNHKTLWRAAVEASDSTDSAIQSANDSRAIESYECYRRAFECDLNTYYPAVAALQMGHILKLMSEQDRWKYLFQGDERKADRYREDLLHELPALMHVAKAAINRDLNKKDGRSKDWAKASKADLLLLELPEEDLEFAKETLVQAYADSIPAKDNFISGATLGQLKLFLKLGYKAEAVKAVVDKFHAPQQQNEHLIVFAGHTFDKVGAPPRFPEHTESKARQLIEDAIKKHKQSLKEDEYLTVLASAAPGADILAHEVCRDLGITSKLCLPVPPEKVASTVFGSSDQMRSRFFNIVDNGKESMMQMQKDDELPRWLQNRDEIDVWERGNRWVMQIAQTSGAERVSMLAFWDGQETGQKGGTEQLVKLARSHGSFRVEVIDSSQVLA